MNENKIQIFKNGEFEIQAMLGDDGEAWFPATSTAERLGYKNPRKAIIDHTDEGVMISYSLAKGGIQQVKFIPESDLYGLIFGSRLPTAKKFKKWVCKEVIPSIRKTGSYSIQQQRPMTYISKGLPHYTLRELKEKFCTKEELATHFPGISPIQARNFIIAAGARMVETMVVMEDGELRHTHSISREGIEQLIRQVDKSFRFVKECQSVYKFSSHYGKDGSCFMIKKSKFRGGIRAYWGNVMIHSMNISVA